MYLNIKMKKFINKNPFFVAEISANHCGSIVKAKKLIRLAKRNGADAVKLQTYTPDMMTIKKNNYKIKYGLWKNMYLWELYKEAQTPLKWHKELFNFAKKIKIKIFSTPFSIEALNFLQKLNCKAYKVASFEMNDINLIKAIAKTNKPMIISTGLATLKEINTTFKIAKNNGCKDITLLYCVSNYPSNSSDFNINNIKILKNKFKCKIGLSDHSKGSEIAKISLVLGAEVFEKHIALENQTNGHDIKFSVKGKEIKKYKEDLLETQKLILKSKFFRSKQELKNKIFRRSIYAINDISKGEKFTNKNIASFRPDIGLSTSYYPKLIGKKSPINIKKNNVLKKDFMKFFI